MKNLIELEEKDLKKINGGFWIELAVGILGSAIYDAIKDPKGTMDSISQGFNYTHKPS